MNVNIFNKKNPLHLRINVTLSNLWLSTFTCTFCSPAAEPLLCTEQEAHTPVEGNSLAVLMESNPGVLPVGGRLAGTLPVGILGVHILPAGGKLAGTLPVGILGVHILPAGGKLAGTLLVEVNPSLPGIQLQLVGGKERRAEWYRCMEG